MKRIFGIMAVTCLTSLGALAQSTEGFFLSKVGAKMEYTITHGPKRKLAIGGSYIIKEITRVDTTENSGIRIITKTLTLNKKRKPSSMLGVKDGSYTATEIATDGSYTIGELLFGQRTESANCTGFLLKIPRDMEVGDTIEGGTSVEMMEEVGINQKFSTTYSNVKVIDERDLTTPAGTFHCYVVKCDSKFEYGRNALIKEDEYWLAKGIGIVLYKTYNYGNKHTYYYELTSLSM